MKRIFAAAAILAGLLLPSPASAAPEFGPPPLFPNGLPKAINEDRCVEGAKRCVWDAKHRGNGKGRSYILTRYRGEYLVFPIWHWEAHELIDTYCDRPRVAC